MPAAPRHQSGATASPDRFVDIHLDVACFYLDIIQGSQSEPVVVAVSENLQLLAVGYDDDGIVLHRGDVTKDRGQRVKVLREKVAEKGKPVTGMSFVTVESQTGGQIYLYVATADDIFMFKYKITKLLLCQ